MQFSALQRVLAGAMVCAAASRANAGSVQFVDTGQQIPGASTTSVAFGDIDGDGDLDAVTPTYVGPILVRLNLGDGTFVEGETIQEGSLSGNLALRDLDGDGDLDIFIVNHSFSTTIYFNDGDGTFTPSGQNLNSASSHALAMGDVDEDGDIDAFIGNIAGHYNAPVLNDGSGVFAYGASNPLPTAREVALGDVNGDGHLDVFLAHADSNPDRWADRVLFGAGDGTFIDSGQLLSMRYTTDVVLADADGDGDLDAFTANADLFGSDPTNTLWLNDGTGHFTDSGQWIGADESHHVAAGDLDLDGDLDIIISSELADEIFLNDGAGGFSSGGNLPVNGFKLGLGDLDGDGDLDIYTLASFGDRVLLNQTIVRASLSDFTVAFGQHLSGGLDSLASSDDERLRIRSRPGFIASEPNLVDLVVGALADGFDPASLSLRVEARSTNPGTTMRLRLRNWPAARWDVVHQFSFGTSEAIEQVQGIAAGSYIRPSDERIQMSLRSSILATFSALGFVAEHDEVAILMRN